MRPKAALPRDGGSGVRKGKEEEAAQGGAGLSFTGWGKGEDRGGCQHQLPCGFQERKKLSPVSHLPSCQCRASLAPELAQPLLLTGKGEGLSYHETLQVGFETTQDQDLQHQTLSGCWFPGWKFPAKLCRVSRWFGCVCRPVCSASLHHPTFVLALPWLQGSP